MIRRIRSGSIDDDIVNMIGERQWIAHDYRHPSKGEMLALKIELLLSLLLIADIYCLDSNRENDRFLINFGE